MILAYLKEMVGRRSGQKKKVAEAESDEARSRDQIKQNLVNLDLFWWAKKTLECFDQRTVMMSRALRRD